MTPACRPAPKAACDVAELTLSSALAYRRSPPDVAFSGQMPHDAEMSEFDAYILCSTPRTGSTLLCRMLSATGAAGRPRSYFRTSVLAEWETRVGLSVSPDLALRDRVAAVIEAVRRENAASGGLCGVRLMQESLAFLATQLDILNPGCTSDAERFAAAFGRVQYLHLSRRDKLDQAISFVKAEQTGLWHRAPDGSEIERLAPPAAPTFDHARIAAQLQRLRAEDDAWTSWFAAEAVTPFALDYDALSAAPLTMLRATLRAIGVAPSYAEQISPETAKLADRASVEWALRFRALEPDLAAL